MAHSSQVKLQARVQPSETFSEFLGEDPILWDVKLTTKGGHVVFAHSAILAARSLYFRSLLRGDQVVHELPEIPVSAKSVGSVLRYMYTDTINFDTDEVESLRELFFVARKWKLFILEALFGKIMGAEVTIPARLPSVWDDLGAMLLGEGNDSADVILQVGARDFRVHRIVLVAASDFFRSLFTMGWKVNAPSFFFAFRFQIRFKVLPCMRDSFFFFLLSSLLPFFFSVVRSSQSHFSY